MFYTPMPGDLILKRTEAKGWYRRLKVWLVGEYDHILIFNDWTKRGTPLQVESINRGVLMRSLADYYGKEVLVLRHENYREAIAAAIRAEDISNDPNAKYDYKGVVRFMLPRLIWFKLTGKLRGFGYRPNKTFICSELADAAYDCAVSKSLGAEPLPGDFLRLPCFTWYKKGVLHWWEMQPLDDLAIEVLDGLRKGIANEMASKPAA